MEGAVVNSLSGLRVVEHLGARSQEFDVRGEPKETESAQRSLRREGHSAGGGRNTCSVTATM
jgi:hypothetical protein